MSEELVQIGFKRYRDDNGKPTCALSFEEGKVCRFFTARTFGTREVCWYAEKQLDRGSREDGAKGLGWLIPAKGCPLWTEEELTP